MSLTREDIVIGAEYEFIDPAYPDWHEQVIRATEVTRQIVRGVVIRPAYGEEINRMHPVGASVDHGLWQIKSAVKSQVELLFS